MPTSTNKEPRVIRHIAFIIFSISILGGCIKPGAVQVNCSSPPTDGTTDPTGCFGTTVFPVPNSFGCIHDANDTSNICATENTPCGRKNKFKCKTTKDSTTNICNCSCM